MKFTDTLLVGLLVLLVFSLFYVKDSYDNNITGHAISGGNGCCLDTCQDDVSTSCSNFINGQACRELEGCNVGCCIDDEGYCYSNYIMDRCSSKGFMFIDTAECDYEFMCTKGDTGMVSYHGYPNVLGRDKGITFADPISGKKGDNFMLYGIMFLNDSLPDNMEVELSWNSSEGIVSLENDGGHGDVLKDDKIFANIWDSSQVRIEDHIELVYYKTIINDVTQMNGGTDGYIMISSNDCIPFMKPYNNPDDAQDIIFVSDSTTIDRVTLQSYGFSIAAQTMILTQQTGEIYNYYTVDGADINGAKGQCPFYNESQDFIIFITDSVTECENSSNMIKINPSFQFYIDQISGTNESIIKDLCSYIYVPSVVQQDLINLYTPADVTVEFPMDGMTITNNTLNVTFIINSQRTDDPTYSYSVYYDVNTDANIVAQGTAQNLQRVTASINLVDGNHDIWVEVWDEYNTIGNSDTVTININ